jgi:hypothetical protein
VQIRFTMASTNPDPYAKPSYAADPAPAYNKYDGPVPPAQVAPMRRGGDRFEQAVDPARGGVFTKRPASTPNRLILNFDTSRCTQPGTGLWESDMTVVPPSLESRGVTQEQWDRYMAKLVQEVQSRQISITACVTLSLLMIPLPYVCFQQYRYQEAAQKWVDSLNEEVLVPRGMFAKFQTSEVYVDNNGGKDGGGYSEELSWLAIAVNPEEVQRLKDEPVFWTPDCCDTSVLVKHPCGCWICFCCCFSKRIV